MIAAILVIIGLSPKQLTATCVSVVCDTCISMNWLLCAKHFAKFSREQNEQIMSFMQHVMLEERGMTFVKGAQGRPL